MRPALADSPFDRPLHVESAVSGGEHSGEVYAVIEQPYGVVAPALARPAHWCDILMLQVNVKRCEAPGAGAAPTVTAFITRKARESVADAHRVEFRYALAAAGADYVRIALTAPSGPVGTSDYRIRLEAAPADASRTLLHLSYAYTLGFMARIAMDAYLATSGRDKAGDLIDCSAINAPGQWNNQKLEKIASAIAAPFGISVSAEVNTGEAFKKFSIEQGETAYEAIHRLCKLRAVLCISDRQGGLLLTAAGNSRAATALAMAGSSSTTRMVRVTGAHRREPVVWESPPPREDAVQASLPARHLTSSASSGVAVPWLRSTSPGIGSMGRPSAWAHQAAV